MKKKLIYTWVCAGLLTACSTYANANITLSIIKPKTGDIPVEVRQSVNGDAIDAILESEIGNLPNITLAERIDEDVSEDEIQFQHKGTDMKTGEGSSMVAEDSKADEGAMQGAHYIVVPKISYARKTDKSIRYTNFTSHRTEYSIELQIKVLDVSHNTLIYSKTYDIAKTLAGSSVDNWTDLLRTAAKEVADDVSFQKKLGAYTPPVQQVVYDKVMFKAAADAMIWINGGVVGTGITSTSLPDGQTVTVRVDRPGYKTWEYPIRISPNAVITIVNMPLDQQVEVKQVEIPHSNSGKLVTTEETTITQKHLVKP